MNQPVPVAVIGAGHMGRHHVRKYAEMPAAKLVAVIDLDVRVLDKWSRPQIVPGDGVIGR